MDRKEFYETVRTTFERRHPKRRVDSELLEENLDYFYSVFGDLAPSEVNSFLRTFDRFLLKAYHNGQDDCC